MWEIPVATYRQNENRKKELKKVWKNKLKKSKKNERKCPVAKLTAEMPEFRKMAHPNALKKGERWRERGKDWIEEGREGCSRDRK